MKFSFLVKNIFHISIFHITCSSTQIIYKSYAEEVKDNLWRDENTLQITTTAFLNEKIPQTFRREKSCTKAKGLVKSKLIKIYPKIKNINPKIDILHSMYLENGGCKIVFLISKKSLKATLKE